MDETVLENVNQVDMANVLSQNVRSTGMGVPFAKMRFPLVDGIHAKVELISNKTGTFYNIGFVKGVKNKINGNIADRILDDFPGVFTIYSVNGHLVSQGKRNHEKDRMKSEIIRELQESYELVPKDKPKETSRDRTGHTKMTSQPKETSPAPANPVEKKKEDKL